MKAFVILDGGGVKGAALAGCLAAAEDRGIEIVAYGGTSAGSIVALLAPPPRSKILGGWKTYRTLGASPT